MADGSNADENDDGQNHRCQFEGFGRESFGWGQLEWDLGNVRIVPVLAIGIYLPLAFCRHVFIRSERED